MGDTRKEALWESHRDTPCKRHTHTHTQSYPLTLRETYTVREGHIHCETHTQRHTHTLRDIHIQRETHTL